ncbi:MAG TPA: murein biosynthesis integral membrane protein MurJ [Sedimentisphaerales bacterium]|nr:murein biosynthesis integral membrane protein MurJ [Sedimentisphaerales bacterium]
MDLKTQNKVAGKLGYPGAGRLGRIVFGLSAIAVLAKVFGFAEKMVVAYFFGAGETTDVYFAAVGMVLSVVFIVKELVYPSLLPVFAASMSESPPASASLFRKVFLSATMFLVVVAAMLTVFPGAVARILVPGFSQSLRETTSGLLRLLAPAALFLGLTMVTYTTLNARRRFMTAALTEAGLKVFVVAGLLALVPSLGIRAVAVVLGIGALSCLLAQLYFIPERRMLFKPAGTADKSRHFAKMLTLMGPLALGVVFSHISGWVDTVLASTLPRGQLSYLGYSKKVIDAILLIVPVALVTVVYSELSHLASAKEHEKFRLLAGKAFRILVYLSVPAACVLIGLREPIVSSLFQRGQFNSASTLGTSRAFAVYAFGLVTLFLEPLFVHTFFALSDTKTPVKYGILCVFLDIGLAILLLRRFEALGIAGAFVISKTIKIVILGAVLHRRVGIFDLRLIGFSAKLAASSAAVWVVLKLLLAIDNPDSFIYTAAYDLMLPAAGALVTFVVLSHVLRFDEFKAVWSLLRFRRAAVGALYGEAK